jgi:hypothetical protein
MTWLFRQQENINQTRAINSPWGRHTITRLRQGIAACQGNYREVGISYERGNHYRKGGVQCSAVEWQMLLHFVPKAGRVAGRKRPSAVRGSGNGGEGRLG